jgi:hypothetical protein
MLADPLHWLSCARLVGVTRIFRHNLIMRVLIHFLSMMGCAVVAEPRISGFNEHGDILAIFPSGPRFLIDVRVTTPTCRSYLAKAQVQGAVAQQHELEKLNKHGVQAAAAHATFVPFVVESYGTFGNEAVKFIKLMAEEVAGATLRSPSDKAVQAFRAEITASVAVALHRGNAACLHRGSLGAMMDSVG